tara:strand:+ start:1892 stop:2173 length:282 start_codon:yes stop_codon:yes gene_type:complete
MIDMELIYIGAGGGLALQLLSLLELPNIDKKDRPDFKDLVYYIPYVLNPILGAFIVFVYLKAQTELNPVLALHIGASAPVILRTMASAIPKIK